MNEDLIHLQNAHVTQHSTATTKTPWKIEANNTNKRLGELPAELSEVQVFAILDFAKEYELIAFNTGIELGKKKYKDVYDKHLELLETNLKQAREENERLATALDNHIRSEE